MAREISRNRNLKVRDNKAEIQTKRERKKKPSKKDTLRERNKKTFKVETKRQRT